MPVVVPGYNTENKVAFVANSEGDINDSITAEAADSWLVSSIIYNNLNDGVIILFTRTIPIVV